MKKLIYFSLFFAAIAITFTTLISRSFRVNQVPNGNVNSCNTCHVTPGGPRNDFGQLVESKFLTAQGASGNVVWGPLLASLDADGDGASNGEELQDPFGLWMEGQPQPGSSALVSAPGESSSSPFSTLTVQFSGMTPHSGQTLELRVFDKTAGKEVGRVTETSIPAAFDVTLDVLQVGHNYNIDFYADHNGNGIYDAPPADHAWRIELDNAQGADVVQFAHNTNFTNIDWNYMFKLQFTGMTPHVGQLLEVRVEDDLTSAEVGRVRVESIQTADFEVNIPGLQIGREYNVEMYADLNQNGLYDAPPTDHAWEINFLNNTGNHTESFAHNTSFKDVGWKYLFTMNFSGMTPHDGQLLEMRVVDQNDDSEIGRTKVEAIPGADFVLSIPQIENDHDYRVDFYADHNGNGMYDAPPADHAWRVTFRSQTGNYVENFAHNTSFTDIQWPPLTNVEDENSIPTDFNVAQNYPNPFNPSTTIEFAIPQSEFVTVRVFNQIGEEVALLMNQQLNSGRHNVKFNANNLASGIYFYQISAGKFNEVKKMMLLK